MQPDETLDRLVGSWRILQLRDGHRYNTDDLLVAWTALRARPDAARLLDLGSGVGSVGLAALWGLPPAARLVAVEVQARSSELARRTIELNGLRGRVTHHHRDLRELEGDPLREERGERALFDLVTANPPFLPAARATLSPHPQRAAARVELHGDIADYARVAALHLAPGGRFCFCHAAADARCEPAVRAAGLRVVSRREVVFREGATPHLTLFTCAHAGESGGEETETTLLIRQADGARSAAFKAIRRALAIDRDFAAELSGVRCWDTGVQAVYEARGEPAVDAVLQNRDELIALCELIDATEVRSYLEIGVWTGRLVSTLHGLFGFERVAACDDGYARRFGLPLQLPPDAHYFEGDSRSAAYAAWRRELGAIDLVFIDADHGYAGVRADFERERHMPHRMLAFHDITGANRHTAGVAKFWRELDGGYKEEIILPHRELGLPHSTMGIGVWRASRG